MSCRVRREVRAAMPLLALLSLVLGVACTAPSPSADSAEQPPRAIEAGNGAAPRSATRGFAGATAFLPPDYECELLVDYEALRELGLLDELERLPGMTDFLRAIGQTYYCELDQIARTRTGMVFDWSSTRPGNRQVSVAEGRDLRPPAELPAGVVQVRVGDWDAVQIEKGPSSRPTAIWPSSSVVVVGGHDLLEPVLRGERAGGVPHSDLLPLAIGDGILMQVVLCGFHGKDGMPFSDFLWLLTLRGHEAGEDLEAGRLRLGVDADERLTLSTTLRFVQGSTRVAAFAQAWRDQLAAWSNETAPTVRKVIADVSVQQDGRDVEIAANLGTLRQAIAKVQSVVLAIMASR